MNELKVFEFWYSRMKEHSKLRMFPKTTPTERRFLLVESDSNKYMTQLLAKDENQIAWKLYLFSPQNPNYLEDNLLLEFLKGAQMWVNICCWPGPSERELYIAKIIKPELK